MFNLRTLISKLSESPEQWLPDQRTFIGIAARNLLRFAWSPGAYDNALVTNAINGVLKTFNTNVAESKQLLSVALTPEHMIEHAYSEMHWIARRAFLSIAQSDPAFAADIYVAAFGFTKAFDAKTAMGESKFCRSRPTGARTSKCPGTRCWRHFPKFIAAYPDEGVRAFARAIEGHVVRERDFRGNTEAFSFHGIATGITSDHSYNWRQFRHYSDGLTLIPHFDAWLDALATSTRPKEAFKYALDLVARYNQLAGVWASIIARRDAARRAL